ncbi:hypothetical protein [Pontimicrobium sp. MEBiC01747]
MHCLLIYIEWEFFISPIFGAILALIVALLEPVFIKDDDSSFKERFHKYGKLFILITMILTVFNKML